VTQTNCTLIFMGFVFPQDFSHSLETLDFLNHYGAVVSGSGLSIAFLSETMQESDLPHSCLVHNSWSGMSQRPPPQHLHFLLFAK
jgi:hypothetical protein